MPHHDKGRLYVETHRDNVICMVAKGLGTQEDQANANLIAAAPELLIFAQDVSNGVIVPELMTHEGLIEVLLGWQKAARAAIAKAIG